MRIPFAQLTFAIGLYRRPSTTHSLADFLATSKAQYLSDIHAHQAQRWTVVMGNEAGDLDSIASSIAYAWIQSTLYHVPTIPLIQTPHHDLPLRRENLHAFSLAGIHDPSSQLLSSSDLPDAIPFPSSTFALVDHNRLGAPYLSPSARVAAVIDHHEDEGLYTTAHPRIISPSGSCTSHIISLVLQSPTPTSLPSDLATLLLSAILIDTSGLKPQSNKTLPVDLRAAAFLASHSAYGPSPPPKTPGTLHQTPEIQTLTRDLLTLKRDVLHLSTRHLLRRDYKEYTHTPPPASTNQTITLQTGISSVPLSLSVLNRHTDLSEAIIAWMTHRHLTVLGVTTSFRDNHTAPTTGATTRSQHHREMAWVVNGARLGLDHTHVDELATKLWSGIENSEILRAKVHDEISLGNLPSQARSRIYQLGNTKASRKVVAPLLRSILESS